MNSAARTLPFGFIRRALVPLVIIVSAVLVPATLAAQDSSLLKDKVEFDGKDGKEIFRLDPEGPEAELQAAGGRKTLATFAKKERVITVELPKSDDLSTVTVDAKKTKFTFADPAGKTRWVLEREPDGDWELFDGAGKLKLELKHKDYGYKIVDGADDETEKGRVKKKEDKISLRNAKGDEVIRTKDTTNALAAGCFLLEGLSLTEKAAFAVAILVFEPDTSGE